MIYRIRNKTLFSTGGAKPDWKVNGKFWPNLQGLASHLAFITKQSDKMLREPASLFKVYGNCTVIEIPENGVGHINEVPFKVWYEEYFNTSEKFARVRKTEKQKLVDAKRTPATHTKTKINPSYLDTKSSAVSGSAVANKPLIWDTPTKTAVERALVQASKFVPNLKLEKFGVHPTSQETFVHLTISGENYALLKL